MPEMPVIIKPNVRKTFVMDIIVILILTLLFLGLIYFLNYFVGLDAYLQIFEYIGVGISEDALITVSLIAVVIVSLIVLIYDYLVLVNIKYEFFRDFMIFQKNIGLVFDHKLQIPYHNIVRISFIKEGLMNNIFNTGTIIIDLSGMKHKEVKLEAIDNVEEIARQIHNSVSEHRYRSASIYQKQQRIDNVLDEERY